MTEYIQEQGVSFLTKQGEPKVVLRRPVFRGIKSGFGPGIPAPSSAPLPPMPAEIISELSLSKGIESENITPLISMCESPFVDVQVEGIRCVANLIEDSTDKERLELCEIKGFVDCIFNLLQSEHGEILCCALSALKILTKTEGAIDIEKYKSIDMNSATVALIKIMQCCPNEIFTLRRCSEVVLNLMNLNEKCKDCFCCNEHSKASLDKIVSGCCDKSVVECAKKILEQY